MRIPSMIFSTTFDRSGSTVHITPINGLVYEIGAWCDRATLLNVPYATFFRHPVTPLAEWSFRVGTLIILSTPFATTLAIYDRVSHSPKKSIWQYTSAS